jgi:hypothetical protein
MAEAGGAAAATDLGASLLRELAHIWKTQSAGETEYRMSVLSSTSLNENGTETFCGEISREPSTASIAKESAARRPRVPPPPPWLPEVVVVDERVAVRDVRAVLTEAATVAAA